MNLCFGQRTPDSYPLDLAEDPEEVEAGELLEVVERPRARGQEAGEQRGVLGHVLQPGRGPANGRERSKEEVKVELRMNRIITTDNLNRWGKFKVRCKVKLVPTGQTRATCLDCSQYLYTQPAPRCFALRRTNVFIRTKGRLQRDMRQRRRLIGLTFAKRIDDIVKRLGDGGTDEKHGCGSADTRRDRDDRPSNANLARCRCHRCIASFHFRHGCAKLNWAVRPTLYTEID